MEINFQYTSHLHPIGTAEARLCPDQAQGTGGRHGAMIRASKTKWHQRGTYLRQHHWVHIMKVVSHKND